MKEGEARGIVIGFLHVCFCTDYAILNKLLICGAILIICVSNLRNHRD